MLTALYILGIIVTFVLFCMYDMPTKPDEAVAYLLASILWPAIITICGMMAFLNVIGHGLLFLIGFVSAFHIRKDR